MEDTHKVEEEYKELVKKWKEKSLHPPTRPPCPYCPCPYCGRGGWYTPTPYWGVPLQVTCNC